MKKIIFILAILVAGMAAKSGSYQREFYTSTNNYYDSYCFASSVYVSGQLAIWAAPTAAGEVTLTNPEGDHHFIILGSQCSGSQPIYESLTRQYTSGVVQFAANWSTYYGSVYLEANLSW